jgi:hypothetical protein
MSHAAIRQSARRFWLREIRWKHRRTTSSVLHDVVLLRMNGLPGAFSGMHVPLLVQSARAHDVANIRRFECWLLRGQRQHARSHAPRPQTLPLCWITCA